MFMPVVDGKEYPYTRAGKKAATQAKKMKRSRRNAIKNKRMGYGHGGEVMPKAKPC